MQCRNCGEKLSSKATFCHQCGTQRIIVEIDGAKVKTFSSKAIDHTLIKPTKKRSSVIGIAVLVTIVVIALAYFLSRPSGI